MTETSSEPQQTTNKSSRKIVGILPLLLFIALAATVFLWHQSLNQYRSILIQQKAMQLAINDIGQVVTNLQKKMSALNVDQHSKNVQLDLQQQQLQHLQTNFEQGELAWNLARVDYLIHAANDQALFMHNAKQATALLTAAKQTLLEANQPQWLPLATALHQDIDTLKALPAVNIDDTMSELAALDSQLNQLPLTVSQFGQADLETPPTVPLINQTQPDIKFYQWAWWQARFVTLWQQLRGILVIRHNDKSIIPIVDEQQQAYLRHNLHLIVFQIKWALLSSNNELYHSSLDQLTQWINDYFNTQSMITKTTLDNIETLQKVQLTQHIPTPTASLTVLQKLALDSTHPAKTDNNVLPDKPTEQETHTKDRTS